MEIDLKSKTAALRRQHILDAAIRIFETRGFRGATIRDVAMEAGVSDGTIYNVFDSKESLLLAILEPLLAASGPPSVPVGGPDALLHADESNAAGLLHGMITTRWTSMTPETLAMMRIVWAEALTNRSLASLYLETVIAPALDAPEPLFQQLNQSGAIVSADIPVTLRLLVASFMGLALLKALGDPVVNSQSDEIGGRLADLLINGLLPRSTSGGNHDAV